MCVLHFYSSSLLFNKFFLRVLMSQVVSRKGYAREGLSQKKHQIGRVYFSVDWKIIPKRRKCKLHFAQNTASNIGFDIFFCLILYCKIRLVLQKQIFALAFRYFLFYESLIHCFLFTFAFANIFCKQLLQWRGK